MTGRERLQAILNGQRVDRLSWTTLVDDTTRSAMPREVAALPVLDFYRSIGCDILQFGNYGLPPDVCVTPPCRTVFPDAEVRESSGDGGTLLREIHTPWGTLTAAFRSGHPTRHPVQTPDELGILTRLWESARSEGLPGSAESYGRADAAIGEDGIYVYTVDPSPVQQLIEFEMGVGAFHYLLADRPTEMEELLAHMHARRLEEIAAVARTVPAPAVVLVENTSSNLLSPAVYRRHSLPQLREYVHAIRRHGRKAILHMCGRLRALLPAIGETGLDGINGLTPPPVGDTTFEEALSALGADLVLLGGVFDPDAFQSPGATPVGIHRALDRLYTPAVRSANLVLWLAADGLPTPVERFMAVREWMDANGR